MAAVKKRERSPGYMRMHHQNILLPDTVMKNFQPGISNSPNAKPLPNGRACAEFGQN